MARKSVPAPAPSTTPPPSPMTFAGLLVRLYWLAFGNIVVFAMFLRSMQHREVGAADAVYWVFGAGMIVVRFLDVRYFHGSTLDGKPASMADWRRYSLAVALLLGAAWSFVRWIAPVSI